MLRGRLGEARGRFGGVLGGLWELLGPLETPLCASEASQGGSGLLPEHLREALGSSREVLGSVSECFGTSRAAFWGFERALGADKTKK